MNGMSVMILTALELFALSGALGGLVRKRSQMLALHPIPVAH